MSDENSTPSEETPDEATAETGADAMPGATFEEGEGPAANEAADAAWREVFDQLDGLAQAAGRWARATVDDPENRKRATELKEHVEKTAREIGDSIDGAADSVGKTDVGASFKEAAGKTGEAFASAGRRVSEETAPRMASAFHGAAEALRSAAEKMEKRPPSPPPAPEDASGEAEETGAGDTQAEPDPPSDAAAE